MPLIFLSYNATVNSCFCHHLWHTETVLITESRDQNFTDDSSETAESSFRFICADVSFFSLFYGKKKDVKVSLHKLQQYHFYNEKYYILNNSKRARSVRDRGPRSAFCLSFLLCLWVAMWTLESEPWNNSRAKWPCEFVYPQKPWLFKWHIL